VRTYDLRLTSPVEPLVWPHVGAATYGVVVTVDDAQLGMLLAQAWAQGWRGAPVEAWLTARSEGAAVEAE